MKAEDAKGFAVYLVINLNLLILYILFFLLFQKQHKVYKVRQLTILTLSRYSFQRKIIICVSILPFLYVKWIKFSTNFSNNKSLKNLSYISSNRFLEYFTAWDFLPLNFLTMNTIPITLILQPANLGLLDSLSFVFRGYTFRHPAIFTKLHPMGKFGRVTVTIKLDQLFLDYMTDL